MLTSRERIRNLLARKPIDCIPNGLGGAETAGLHLLAYDRLRKVLGVHNIPGDTPEAHLRAILGISRLP